MSDTRITFRLTPEERAALERLAAARGLLLSDLIREILRRSVRRAL